VDSTPERSCFFEAAEIKAMFKGIEIAFRGSKAARRASGGDGGHHAQLGVILIPIPVIDLVVRFFFLRKHACLDV
jgi:hypothetical protein